MEIRTISKAELKVATELVWQVFQEFEAPDYSKEGIKTFRDFLDGLLINMTVEMYGAFEKGELLGVIATRKEGSHIALFFVAKKHHRKGIGKKLFQHILSLCCSSVITVNSSPYAVKVYRKLGFSDTDTEQLTDGLRYVPMKYTKKQVFQPA